MNNEPVLVEGVTAMAFAVFGGWLIQHGITQAGANLAANSIIGGVAAAWGVVRLFIARAQVTPTAKLLTNVNSTPAAAPAAPAASSPTSATAEPFRPV